MLKFSGSSCLISDPSLFVFLCFELDFVMDSIVILDWIQQGYISSIKTN